MLKFIRRLIKNICLSVVIVCFSPHLYAQSVSVQYDTSSLQAAYASQKIKQCLENMNYVLTQNSAQLVIVIEQDDQKLTPEAYTISRKGEKIIVTGADGRGVIYGALSLIEDLQNGHALESIEPRSESTQLHFRAIKYDLPWDTYRHSSALYQHQQTCSDLAYWEAFLDMLCANRFNALTLWNLHPYTFLIKPQNFPEASPWTEQEMRQWQKLFKGIFHLAKERGIDTYIMPFNIFVTPEFARAHNVAMDNLEHHHFVQADTSAIIKRYTRECVTQMLNEYPDLSGIGLTLGEGMGGMTPQQRENWMHETIIEGMRLAKRPSKLIHRIPFSGNTGSLGATNIEMEQITRKGIEQEAAMDFIETPVWASLKFNWSHPHSTSSLIKVHGGKIYGTYWNPEPDGYKMVWTVRNEDFFCLRWGSADFIREHLAKNVHDYVGGYFIGSETYIPAKDYFTNPDFKVSWTYAFERQWLFYKLWGRLLYNRQTPEQLFKNEFIGRYGPQAEILFEAYGLVSKTPLRLASSFDCTWDFTLYSEGFSALDPETRRVDYISIQRQINQPPLDTNYISIPEYVEITDKHGTYPAGKITPPQVAAMLKDDCHKALELVKNIDVSADNDLMFEVADIKAWAYMGLFLAEKIMAAVALHTFQTCNCGLYKNMAIQHLEKALHFWDEIIAITRPIYNDMPLVHYSEQDGKSWQENDHLRFHWALLRPAVLKDIEIAKNAEFVDE